MTSIFVLLLWWAICIAVWHADWPKNENVRVLSALVLAWLGLAGFAFLQSGNIALLRAVLLISGAAVVTWAHWRLRRPSDGVLILTFWGSLLAILLLLGAVSCGR